LNNSPTMNTEDEKLCLKWNEFQENTISAFGTLRHDKEFADVTLACEDGQQVEAHKVILASSSPFFLNLLKRNKHPHPLIYMRGLKSEDLVAMVDFLYYGEANVFQENLDSFLAAAEELQLKGLMGSSKESEDIEYKQPPKKKAQTNMQSDHFKLHEALSPVSPNLVEKVETEPPEEKTVAVTDYTVSTDLQSLDDTIKTMIEISEQMVDTKHGRVRICKVCGKEGELGNIKQHIEASHITGVSHTCNICGNTASSRHALRTHNSKYHTKRIIKKLK